ncbi:MAG TPA: RNA polymerase sigma factor [Streptosporangiaceae bacterium]|jgi:RNA polymerase sigma factor (sigma-70 family)
MSVEPGGAPADDRSMAEALRDAGRDVFAYLYESFAAPLFDYCSGILRDPWAAAEVVQDSLVAVDAQMNQLPDPDQIRLWLYTIARQHCLSRLAVHQLASRPATITLDEFIGELSGSMDRYPDAGAVATERERLRIVTAALDSLADRDREVLSLAYRHGLAGADLASVLGVNHRRGQVLLSGAGGQFRESATAIAVLRAGRPACQVLEANAVTGDDAKTLLAPKVRKRIVQHIATCPSCIQRRGDRDFGPELITAIPFTTPPVNLGLRISRTASALGTYRSGAAGRSVKGSTGSGKSGIRRSMSRSVVAPSVAVAVLIVPGTMLVHLIAQSFPGPSAVVITTSGVQTPAAGTGASSAATGQPTLTKKTHAHRAVLGPLPGLLGPMPVGVLSPVSPAKSGNSGQAGQGGSGGSPQPAPNPPPTSSSPAPNPPPTSSSPTPPPTTPPPTTPPPTTPPPTTPPPSPSPDPPPTSPDPTPSASAS